MAALQTLRNKAAVFITIIIALALLAFIMTDLLNSGSTLFSDADKVGTIDGQTIKYQDYFRLIEVAEERAKLQNGGSLSEEQQNQVREQVWQQLIQDITFGKVYEDAGVDVTDEEIRDMAAGDHIAPVFRQNFTDPQTGVYNRAYAEQFISSTNLDEQSAFIRQAIFEDLVRTRKGMKYMNLINKSIFCNSVQVEVEKAKRSNNVDVAFVSVRYSSIPDSTINVSDSEIKSRFQKDKELYKVGDSRDIEYVSFPIRPSEADRVETREALEALKADFANPETDPVRFAQINSDVPVRSTFLKLDQLNSQIASFAQNAQPGDVYGPYFNGSSFKLSRLVSIAQRPDSVKARHILIRNDEKLADSLLAVVKGGADFAQVAKDFSQDPGSAINGGDLGWFNDGVMVPEFNEACFTNAKGSILKVQSQFGFHIIQVQDRGVESQKYNVLTIEKNINYSSRTQNDVYSHAQTVAAATKDAESFAAMVDSSNLVKRVGRNIRSNAQNVNSLQHARDLVKWAFKAKVGEVSDLFQCDDEYVIAILTKAQEQGYAKIEDVSPSISRLIRNDKKAEIISSATQGKSLSEIAAQYNTKVDTARNVSFAANSVSGAGVEPALVGSVISAEKAKVVSAVKGNNAAYAFEVLASEPVEVSDDQIRNAYLQQLQGLPYNVSQIVTDVEIKDNRINFY